MKTPEEMAEEYVNDLGQDFDRLFPSNAEQPFIETFLAGYKAAAPQWISVKDRMPEPDTCVLIRQDDTIWVSGFCNALKMWGHYENGETCAPTHWMPLPEPPKEEE